MIALRPLTEEDATEEYAAWLNDPDVNRYLETRQITVAELREYIASKKLPRALLMGIFSEGKHIGNVKLEPIEDGEATMGLLIGDKNSWGKGIGTEVTNMICTYAGETLRLRALNLTVIAPHAAAIHLYEKCGFQKVGVNPKALDHAGVLFDQVVMRRNLQPWPCYHLMKNRIDNS